MTPSDRVYADGLVRMQESVDIALTLDALAVSARSNATVELKA